MLSIVGQLHHVNVDMLGWWLSERQLPSGGLNGSQLIRMCFDERPKKLSVDTQ